LYQIYSQLILPIPSQLEHLRTPEETDNNDQSVPVPPSTLMSVSAGVRSGEPQADSSRQRFVILFFSFFKVRFSKKSWFQVIALSNTIFRIILSLPPVCHA
jgi:hypothetical protein